MTREESIAILDGFKHNPLFNQQHFEALDMAISALSENKGFDGMTNGEVIQALFPNPHIETKSHTVWVGYDEMSFTRKWWNAPYKAESEGTECQQ